MSQSTRLQSLDALRGLTIIAMIIVNTPGSWSAAYAPLCHAEWTGCTPTDLVFPFFLFIMGFSLFLSTQNRLMKGATKRQLFLHLAKRSALIFLIGVLLYMFPFTDITNFRILGVLQRIALVNFFCGLMLLYTSRKFRLYTGGIILIGYWILLAFIPSPLSAAPTLAYETNWVAWLDQLVLGKHTWSAMPLMDPEGILSTLPAIVTGLLGTEIAFYFSKTADKTKKAVVLFLAGFLLTAAGLAWSPVFPFIKKLWTSSYVLYTAGLASMTLGAFYWLIDYLKKDSFTGLLVAFGKNPLVLYVGSELLIIIIWQFPIFGPNNLTLTEYFFNSLVNAGMSPNNASLAWAVAYTSIFGIAAWIMYRKKVIIKL
jgi:predicted acyltransferase